MKTPILLALLAAIPIALQSCSAEASSGEAASVSLTGAGASFPAPLYSTWFQEFSRAHPSVRVNYQSIGSGAGVNRTVEGLVDFGASDSAMQDDEIALVERGVRMLPMTAGGVVVAYNLEGVDDLKLSRDALAGVFLGEIKTWNDPRIAADNPGADLPAANISVFTRADGSGTTYAFTNHLDAISPTWSARHGVTKKVDWPAGFRGGKGNEGVTAFLKQTNNSIGYVEFGFAELNHIPMASLQNQHGAFVHPSIESCQAAMANAEMPQNLRVFLPDPAGEDSYSIVTYTWILAYETYDAAKLEPLQRLLRWCLTDGQARCAKLGYVPLPDSVRSQVLSAVEELSTPPAEPAATTAPKNG